MKEHEYTSPCKEDLLKEIVRNKDYLTEEELLQLRMLSCSRNANRIVRAAHEDPVSATLQSSIGSLLLGAAAASLVMLLLGGVRPDHRCRMPCSSSLPISVAQREQTLHNLLRHL